MAFIDDLIMIRAFRISRSIMQKISVSNETEKEREVTLPSLPREPTKVLSQGFLKEIR